MPKALSFVSLLGSALSLGSGHLLNGTHLYQADSTTASSQAEEKPTLKTEAQIRKGINSVEEELNALIGISSSEILGSKIIRDFANNEYLFVSFSGRGYGVLNVSNDDVVELAPFAPYPIDVNAETDDRYVPWVGFFQKEGENFRDLKTGLLISEAEREVLADESAEFLARSISDANEAEERESDGLSVANGSRIVKKSAPVNHSLSAGLLYADKEIPYAWYFKRNFNSFPSNDGDDCGYVAASMLLAYSEIFECTGYFSSSEAATYITPYNGTRSTVDGEATWDGVPKLSNAFPYGAWGSDIGGSTPSEIDSAIKGFLSKKSVSYSLYHRYWEFGSPQEPINSGHPVACFGNYEDPNGGDNFNHVTVVYGYYNDGKLLCHFGWNGYSQVVMSQLGMFHTGGFISIYNQSTHRHNKYFVDKSTGKRYCGCGRLMTC